MTWLSTKDCNYFTGLINETIKIREEKGIVRPDLIYIMTEARKGINKKEENEIIDTGFATAQESLEKGNVEKNMKISYWMDLGLKKQIFFCNNFILICVT